MFVTRVQQPPQIEVMEFEPRPIGNESAPIQLAQCRFPAGPAISNAKIIFLSFRLQIKYAEAILSDSTGKLVV